MTAARDRMSADGASGRPVARRTREGLVDRVLGSVPTEASLDRIAFNPDNPRETLDEDYITRLAANMLTVGQIQPATVMTRIAYLVAHPDHQDDIPTQADFVVVDGHCRLAAARAAGLARLKIAPDDSAAGTPEDILTAALSANHFRKDLSYLEEARALEVLVAYHGSAAAVATALGGNLNAGWISQRRALLALPEDLQQRVDTGEIPLEIARAAGRKGTDEQRPFVEARLAERAAARAHRSHRQAKAPVKASGQTPVRDTRPDVYAVKNTSAASPSTTADPLPAEAKPSICDVAVGESAVGAVDWASPEAVVQAIRLRMTADGVRQVARSLGDTL